MEEILKIDSEIKSYIDNIELHAKKLKFNPLGEFKLDLNNVVGIPWHTFHYPGIYLFEIKNNGLSDDFSSWVKNFKHQWMDDRYVKSFTPNLTKKRVKAHTELSEWIPIYIGKSHDVEGRVHQHVFKNLESTTFALKLNSRENLYNETFRISSLEIDLKNYNALMPMIEWTLREKFNPILGR